MNWPFIGFPRIGPRRCFSWIAQAANHAAGVVFCYPVFMGTIAFAFFLIAPLLQEKPALQ
jgi:hypothetical protein